ncbi:MAG: transcriptional regulator NrdR [Candidatus Saganbacteria bacterium]|jgi:transcriptional repressor NrdR|nr:transcriptional regulator NrdR [Candidatus Saganbacteria bacterium]
MKCPYCDHEEDKVLDSRPSEGGKAVRRRRECLNCGSRFTSYERVEERDLMVIKRDGRREEYSREKILGGIKKACEKRPVSMDEIDKMANEVEKRIFEETGKEIESGLIGKFVMEKLERRDDVAYVRFASVYRQFQDVSEFLKEIKEMSSNN